MHKEINLAIFVSIIDKSDKFGLYYLFKWKNTTLEITRIIYVIKTQLTKSVFSHYALLNM